MKRFKGVVVLLLVFSLVFAFASCGTSQKSNNNPMASGGVDITNKVPDTGLFVYFNVSRENTKALQDLQKKLIDAGILPLSTENSDASDLIETMRQVMDKYSDITKGQYGIIAIDLKKVKELEDKDIESVKPEDGVYMVFVAQFTKEVKVKNYLGDVQSVVEKLKNDEDMKGQIVVNPTNGTMTVKPEGGPEITFYFENKDKNIIMTLGEPFSKMPKVDKPISKNEFWKEASSHSFAVYLDPTAIPDEDTRNELVNAGWQKPIRVFGDITSSEKDGVYTSNFTLSAYNPTGKKFTDLGISGDVKVVKNADIILALDTDLIVNMIDMASDTTKELEGYKQMADMLSGGVITLSGAIQSTQKMAGALIGQYFKDPSKLWGMISGTLDQYLEGLKYSVPGVYTKSQQTEDGFDIIVGTYQPQMVSEKIDGAPVLYLRLNIDPDKYKDIFSSLDPELKKTLDDYAKVVDNVEITLKVTYDEGKNITGLAVSSVVKTK